MPDSGRGSGGWKFALLFLLLAIEAGIASFWPSCWFVAKNMPGSMVGAVC